MPTVACPPALTHRGAGDDRAVDAQPDSPTDAQLDAVMSAARPLPVEMRDPFLQAVAHALSGRDVVGPGTVHQVCREQQRIFMNGT
jgi:hypothetical protein